jgi:hypothetical protein
MSETDPVTRQDAQLADNLKSRSIWMRLLFMLIVIFLYSISRIVVAAVVAMQFVWKLFTGETNDNLLELGRSLATYTEQVVLYLTFNTEDRPYPFDLEWPEK